MDGEELLILVYKPNYFIAYQRFETLPLSAVQLLIPPWFDGF
jgi:hypothetical protein